MTCDELRSELIPYHFGEVPDGTRRLLEAHLPGCPACVTELLSLKRAIEVAEDAPRPSDVARARLRAAVAAEIGAGEPGRAGGVVGAGPRRRWERPLAFAFAASAVLAAMVAMRSLTSGPGAPPLGAAVTAPDAPGE
jgi:anti-sigma factor RsiW